MQKTKIGTLESIFLILTVVVTHCMLTLPKEHLTSIKSSSLLNILYIGIIALILGYLIFKLLKQFPRI